LRVLMSITKKNISNRCWPGLGTRRRDLEITATKEARFGKRGEKMGEVE
jgi:hypothetical protein